MHDYTADEYTNILGYLPRSRDLLVRGIHTIFSLAVSPDLLKAKGKALGNLGGLYEEKTTNMERVPIICWQPVTYNLQLHVL